MLDRVELATLRRSDLRVIQRSDMALNQQSDGVTVDERAQVPFDRQRSLAEMSAELTQRAMDSVLGKESQPIDDLPPTISI